MLIYIVTKQLNRRHNVSVVIDDAMYQLYHHNKESDHNLGVCTQRGNVWPTAFCLIHICTNKHGKRIRMVHEYQYCLLFDINSVHTIESKQFGEVLVMC